MTRRSSAYVVTLGRTGRVGIYPTVIVTSRTVGSAEILRILSPSGIVGIGIAARTSRIRGTCIATIISVAIISSMTIAVWVIKIGIAIIATISKAVIGIIKAQSPVGSAVEASVKWSVIPERIVERIIETPVVIEIAPRVVVDKVNFCSGRLVTPGCLRIDLYLTIAIVTAVVVSIGINVVLRIVQRRIVIRHITEIVFVIDS